MTNYAEKFNIVASQGFRHHVNGTVEPIATKFGTETNPDLATDNAVTPGITPETPGLG